MKQTTASASAKAKLAQLRKRKRPDDDDDSDERAERTEREAVNQAEHDTLVRTVRAIVTAEFDGDYQSGVEFLAAVYLAHCNGRRVMAIDVLEQVDTENKDYN